MQRLRQARFLARLVLAWFALALGVAMAAPVLHPQGFDVVCSASGAMKLLDHDTGSGPAQAHTLDCPLCLPMHAPPPVAMPAVEPPHALAHVLQPTMAQRIASLARAALPARGPPVPGFA
jgi:hypothetical protein